MGPATTPPFPHLSWVGAWTAVGAKAATVKVSLRQVNHCLIYGSGAKSIVRWVHRDREERFTVEPGTVWFCPADDDKHTLIARCNPGHAFYTLLVASQHLTCGADPDVSTAASELRSFVSRRDAVLTVGMRRLAEAARSNGGPSPEEQEEAALSLLLRIMAMNGRRGPDWRNDSSVLDRHSMGVLVDFIDTHLRVAPAVGDMAELVGLSPSHFAMKFRRSTGLSPHRFVNRRRIRKAVAMLQKTLSPIAVIAHELGFSSHSHLTRLVTKTTGMSPVLWREQFRALNS